MTCLCPATLDGKCRGYIGAFPPDFMSPDCECECHTDIGWKPVPSQMPSTRYVDGGPRHGCRCNGSANCESHGGI